MKILGFLLRHIIPIGIIAGVGFLVFNAARPPAATRIDSLGVDLLSSPPLTAEAVEADLNALQQAGVEYVSIEVNWTIIESSQDEYEWSRVVPLDLFFTSARSRGIKSVAVLTGYPIYLTETGSTSDQTALGARWEKFVQAAVGHFGDQVDIWQIGDQVNSSLAARSLAQADPGFYAKMLRSANKIIKRADSNDQVWMGSLVSATADNCAVNPLTFMLDMNGAKAWNSADAITFSPRRGAVAPESPSSLAVNQACTSSMTINPETLSTEVQSLQELARQLGGKALYVTGFSWSPEEIMVLQNGRNEDAYTLQSDLLVRGSAMLMGANTIPLLLWQVDPQFQQDAMNSLSNMNSLLKDAKPLGQVQGQGGSVQEYRFQKRAALDSIAWRSQDGDAAQPVILSDLAGNSVNAFPCDAATLNSASGTPIQVDQSGTALVMLNERPVLFAGKVGGWDQQIKALAQDQADIWRIDLQKQISSWLNQLKTMFLQWLEELFNQAKDSAVDWGEGKIKDLLN